MAMEDELLQRQAPQSLEAEQALLGSILIDSRCIADVIGIVKPEDFYLQQNREIFEAVYTMFNFSETIDPVTILNKMQELGTHHDNSRSYVLQLMEITPTAANAARYAGIVRERPCFVALRRQPWIFPKRSTLRLVPLLKCWKAPKKRFTACVRASATILWNISAPFCTRSSTV